MSAVDIVHEDGAPIQATLDLWSGAPGSSRRERHGTSPSKSSLRTYATRLVPVQVRAPAGALALRSRAFQGVLDHEECAWQSERSHRHDPLHQLAERHRPRQPMIVGMLYTAACIKTPFPLMGVGKPYKNTRS